MAPTFEMYPVPETKRAARDPSEALTRYSPCGSCIRL